MPKTLATLASPNPASRKRGCDELEDQNTVPVAAPAVAAAPVAAAAANAATNAATLKARRFRKRSFQWNDTDIDDTEWNRVFCAMYFKLSVFKNRHGHTNVVPSEDDPDNINLGQWVCNLRLKATKELLDADQLAALDEIGFIWNTREEASKKKWLENFEKLVEYKARYGTTIVPYNYVDEIGLARWVHEQRQRWNLTEKVQQNKELPRRTKSVKQFELLPMEFKAKLDSIGFQWKVHEGWEKRYEQLKQYKEQFGDCNVPQHYSENKSLGKWVARQRYNYCLIQQDKVKPNTNELDEDRIHRLNELGFNWGRFRPNTWNKNKQQHQQQQQPPHQNNPYHGQENMGEV